MWGATSTAQISPSSCESNSPGWKVTRTSYAMPGEVSAGQRLRRQLRAAQQHSEAMRRDAVDLSASLQRKAEASHVSSSPPSPAVEIAPHHFQRRPFAEGPLAQPRPNGAEGGHYLVPRRQENLRQIKPPRCYEVGRADVDDTVPKELVDTDREAARSAHLWAAPADTAMSGEPLQVRVGSVEFESFGYTPGLFETSGFRIMLQSGRAPIRWVEGQPTTERREMKYSKAVASDGRYSARLTCDFDEDLEVLVPSGTETLLVDVWLESRTFVEQLDSLLDMVGLGNNLPEFSHTFLGRVTASIPPEDVEAMVQSYPVKVGLGEGPRPKAMSIGMRWADERS